MADESPGFGETNTPERAGGIVRDHVRAVIESAEGNAAEIRRRAREDAEALDKERADSASRLTTQLGELEGSFTSFGERLGQEVLPSGEIKGELGAGDRESAAAESPTAAGGATAWRAPAQESGAAEDDPGAGAAPEEEGPGLLGGLKRRFGPSEEDAQAEADAPETSPEWATSEEDALADPSPQDAAPPAASTDSSDWVPETPDAGETETSPAAVPPDPSESVSWAPSPAPDAETGTEESAATDEQEDLGRAPEPAEQDTPDDATSGSEAPEVPPRGRIARLLLGRRPGE